MKEFFDKMFFAKLFNSDSKCDKKRKCEEYDCEEAHGQMTKLARFTINESDNESMSPFINKKKMNKARKWENEELYYEEQETRKKLKRSNSSEYEPSSDFEL